MQSATKCDRLLLQSATGVTKCDRMLLQSEAGITKCDSYDKVKHNQELIQKSFEDAAVVRRNAITTVIKHSWKTAGKLNCIVYIHQWVDALAKMG